MNESCIAIIDKLVEIRRKKGITQTQLAASIGLPQPVIARVESKKHAPQLDTLVKIATALECEIKIV